jgi:hypothetical protein
MSKAVTMFILLVVAVIVVVPLIWYLNEKTPHPTGEIQFDLDTSSELVQGPCTKENISKTIDNVTFTIEPVATFSGTFHVLSVRHHYNSPVNELSPVDLCVAWGKVAEPQYLEHINFSLQAGRWCSWSWDSSIGLEKEYINSHIANIHGIPSNDNISKALKSVKKGQKVYVEGYLVNVYQQGRCIARTSLTREDSDCEFLYLVKIIIGNKVYGSTVLQYAFLF